MTLAINIILSAIVLTAIVGSLIWAIVTSRDGQATAPTRLSVKGRELLVGRVENAHRA